jgi:predicted nucleotide-binding protein (sugar kinase/HSP70/actin superfamily)
MSKCPYTNFKNRVLDYINILRTPREEYGNMPPCPFVGNEIDKNKLLIEKFDPSENTIIEMIEKLESSEYDSALFVQVSDENMQQKDTVAYQHFINKLLVKNGYKHLKCICFNPNDKLNINGFNPRSLSPYFLINIAKATVLSKAHTKLMKTKYFDNMNEKYLKYLQVKKDKI